MIELYIYYISPVQELGVVRWWMVGYLIGYYANVSFPTRGCFTEFQFSPTWGGVGDVKRQTDYFWFAHVYISYPSAAPTTLFQEGFEDAKLATRGWYGHTTPLLSAAAPVASGV